MVRAMPPFLRRTGSRNYRVRFSIVPGCGSFFLHLDIQSVRAGGAISPVVSESVTKVGDSASKAGRFRSV